MVDDEEGVRALFEQILTAEGYAVLTAANGRQALQVLRGRKVDLVITDLLMPEADGIETIREIRSSSPGMKIIAMSGELGGKYLDMAMPLGASAVIRKPVSSGQLLRAIREVFT